jgi:hypothetical protein
MPKHRAVRITGGLVSCVAAATSYTLHTLSLNKRAQIKKLRAFNHQPGNVRLTIGYLTNAALPVFTPVMPDILLIAGMDFAVPESELPVCGNTPEGFAADTTATTGTLGDIVCQVSAAGAAPSDVEVQVEVEEM